MNLKKIIIRNYKSIESLEVPITRVNGSLTFSLLGVNESGKSSILKAISFIERKDIVYPLDFHDKDKRIKVTYCYELDAKEIADLKLFLQEKFEAPATFTRQIEIKTLHLTKEFSSTNSANESKDVWIEFEREEITSYSYQGGKIVPDNTANTNIALNSFFNTALPEYFWKKVHTVVFWKSEPKYLITSAINLQQFSGNPRGISIPLLNCFELIGVQESRIASKIAELNDPAAIYNLEQRLNDKVTEHISKVWYGHPILLKFKINNNHLSLLVEDEGVSYDAKVTSQRSDGFRQFISFLLTISIESSNEKLNNTILLLDEPETHLHPTAQLNLRDELLKITRKREDNNLVFYATHSNYLIDKSNLNRSFKVRKVDNVKTELLKIPRTQTSYSEINFEIFDIPTNDYHNELYGFIEANDQSKLDALPKDKVWVREPTRRTFNVSLSTYIRHSIHHPENQLNRKFTEASLRKSIRILRKIKEEIS
ncbi:MAG: AAA family ATPase [Cyanobacteria bacterium J06649_11]